MRGLFVLNFSNLTDYLLVCAISLRAVIFRDRTIRVNAKLPHLAKAFAVEKVCAITLRLKTIRKETRTEK